MNDDRGPKNYLRLFSIFDDDSPTKTGKILESVGSIGFAIAILIWAVGPLLESRLSLETLDFLAITGGLGFALGLFMFIATGVYYAGRRAGRNFWQSLLHMIGKVLLYIFVPSLIITAIIVAIAMLLHAPGVTWW